MFLNDPKHFLSALKGAAIGCAVEEASEHTEEVIGSICVKKKFKWCCSRKCMQCKDRHKIVATCLHVHVSEKRNCPVVSEKEIPRKIIF